MTDDAATGEGRAPDLPAPLASTEQHEACRRLLDHADTRRTVQEGTVISRHGDPCDGLHVIEDGVVNFSRMNLAGEEILFHVGLPGFWFGLNEVRSLGGTLKPLNAVAATAATVASVPEPAVEHLLANDPLVRRYFTTMLMCRYAALLDMVETGLKSDPEARLATRLLAFARINVLPGALPPRMDLPVSQATLSALTGVSRQTVNRSIKKLVETGVLERIYGGVRIVDFEKLAVIAGEALTVQLVQRLADGRGR